MEAASVAWEPLGWKAVGFSEIEPFPCAILKHRFPETPNYGSLTEYKNWPLEPGAINLLVGGTPCQSFSVAGLRKGLDDPRGNLALVFLGLADKLRPRWIVWENVPGVLSSNGGRDFGSFLGALGKLGFGFAYRVLNAENFGVAQRRRRVFVVACRDFRGWELAAKVLFESESLRGDSSPMRKTRERTPADSETSLNESTDNIENQPIPINTENMSPSSTSWGNTFGDFGESQFALTKSHTHAVAIPLKTICFKVRGGGNYSGTKGGEIKPDKKGGIGYLGSEDKTFTIATTQDQWVAAPMAVRRLTPRECERLQGFPDDWSLIPWKGKPASECPDGPRYKACGNSMAVPVMRWIGSRIAQVEKSISSPPTK